MLTKKISADAIKKLSNHLTVFSNFRVPKLYHSSKGFQNSAYYSTEN